MGRHQGIYAFYKGDKFLCEGTKEEICKQMNIAMNTLNYYRTTHWLVNRNKNSNNCRILIKIDDEDKFFNNLQR